MTSLAVNATNMASACVDVDTMNGTGLPCVLISLTNHFMEMLGSGFAAWSRLEYGGGNCVHLTLFSY